MNILLLTYGSRGDVQPFLALGIGLRNAGHVVTIAAPYRFAEFIEQSGIRCVPLAGDPEELSQLFNDAGRNVYQMVRSMQKHVIQIAPDVDKVVHKALQGIDLLIHSFVFTTGAHSFACELGIPDVSIQLFPVFAPTRSFPAIGMPETGFGLLNFFSHWFSTRVFWHAGNVGYYQLRRQMPADFSTRLHWPFDSIPGRPMTPLIFAYSPVVIGKPDDWDGNHIHIPGYFFLDQQNYQPPVELHQFLESGDPPVCITFGSMVNQASERIARSALEAVRQTKRRAIYLTGWSGWKPEASSIDTLFLDSAPHDWLFQHCHAVIHHGGAGTTAAALRAGTPAIIIPHAVDQPFWGNRAAEIGVGPKPIPLRNASIDVLASALKKADAELIRRRAEEVGRLIRSENGVAQTISLIEEHARTFRR